MITLGDKWGSLEISCLGEPKCTEYRSLNVGDLSNMVPNLACMESVCPLSDPVRTTAVRGGDMANTQIITVVSLIYTQTSNHFILSNNNWAVLGQGCRRIRQVYGHNLGKL